MSENPHDLEQPPPPTEGEHHHEGPEEGAPVRTSNCT